MNNWLKWNKYSNSVILHDPDTLCFDRSNKISIGIPNHVRYSHLFTENTKYVWNWNLLCTAYLESEFNVGFDVHSKYIDTNFYYFTCGFAFRYINPHTLIYKFIYYYHDRKHAYSTTDTGTGDWNTVTYPLVKFGLDYRYYYINDENRYGTTINFSYGQSSGSFSLSVNYMSILDLSIQNELYGLFNYSEDLNITSIDPKVWGHYPDVTVQIIDSKLVEE